MKNKKGLSQVLMSIVIFGLFIFIFLFFTVGLKQIYSENIISPVLEKSIAAGNGTLTAGTVNTLNGFKTQYDTQWFNYDIFFLVLVLAFSIITITSSYKSAKLGFRSFFGYLTIGSWLFLLIVGLITQVTDWLLLNFYTNLFNTTLVSTPIINWFIQNLGFYCFGLFIISVLANQLDINNILRREEGRVEE